VFSFPDCFSGQEKIQCGVPACVPVDQGSHIYNIYVHCDNLDSNPWHDGSGHLCLHPCVHANRMGFAPG
jgi:hypothetical protein